MALKGALGVCVVIPTYNRASQLKHCLDSVMKQTYEDFEIVVIDNGCTDETSALLKHYPVKTIRDATKNLFYLCNLGWQHASVDIVAYISDDCEADPCWLKQVVDTFACEDKIAAVGGPAVATRKQEIVNMYEASQNSTVLKLATRIYDIVVMESKFFEVGVLCESGAYSMGGSMVFSARLASPMSVDFLTITNMALRRDALEDVEGFDENYMQHHGDADISIRLRKKGYKLVFQPRAIVWHHPGQRGPARNVYDLAKDYAQFYLRDVKPSSLQGCLRLSLNILYFNTFWLYKTLQSRSITPLSGVHGFIDGFFKYLLLRKDIA